MQRDALPALRGMWFPFDRPQPLRFWMFNTLAPLDMLFVRQGRVIAVDPQKGRVRKRDSFWGKRSKPI